MNSVSTATSVPVAF